MHNPFSAYHPTVAFVYLAAMICLGMLAFHPVFAVISVAGAVAASCVCKGAARTLHSLGFVVLMWAIVSLANFAFSQAGNTILFELFGHAFRLEALCYGMCMGGMLAGTLLWFMVYSQVMDSEASAAVFGSVLPTVSLMISQVMRLVPQFIKRGHAVGAVQNAMSAAAPVTRRDKTAAHAQARHKQPLHFQIIQANGRAHHINDGVHCSHFVKTNLFRRLTMHLTLCLSNFAKNRLRLLFNRHAQRRFFQYLPDILHTAVLMMMMFIVMMAFHSRLFDLYIQGVNPLAGLFLYLQFKFLSHRQFLQFLLQISHWHTGLQQCAQKHIAADTGKTIQI